MGILFFEGDAEVTYKVLVMNLCKIVDYWMKESDRHRSGVRQGIARP